MPLVTLVTLSLYLYNLLFRSLLHHSGWIPLFARVSYSKVLISKPARPLGLYRGVKF